MSVPILGNKRVVYFGPATDPKRDAYYAERGLVHHVDTTTGQKQVMVLRDFLQRVKAVNDLIGGSVDTRKDATKIGIDLARQQQFVEDAIELAKRVKEQGTPDDPSARKDLVNRRRKIMMVPGLAPSSM